MSRFNQSCFLIQTHNLKLFFFLFKYSVKSKAALFRTCCQNSALSGFFKLNNHINIQLNSWTLINSLSYSRQRKKILSSIFYNVKNSYLKILCFRELKQFCNWWVNNFFLKAHFRAGILKRSWTSFITNHTLYSKNLFHFFRNCNLMQNLV